MERTSAARTGAVKSLGRSPVGAPDHGRRFADRRDAGRRLAKLLGRFRDEHPVVVGMARGGVPVAAEVARALDAPLDVVVVRKVGAPLQPEFAIGALAEGGIRLLSDEVVEALGIEAEELEALVARQQRELGAGLERYRAGVPPRAIDGRTVLLVDDGLATGRSARAAALSLRKRGAARVVLAVPVAAPTSLPGLQDCVDEVVCVEMPTNLWAVGLWYDDFTPTADSEVVSSMEELRQPARLVRREVAVDAGPRLRLPGDLTLPPAPRGIVVFAHGSGSSRLSPRNRAVADALNRAGIATLLFDLLTPAEEADRRNVFDIPLLATRLLAAMRWVHQQPETHELPLGFFGASTGAAAALVAAAEAGPAVAAVVSRGGRPDLAGPRLAQVVAPTLLIVGSEDREVLELNHQARRQLGGHSELAIVPGATHLFEEPGALEQVQRLAADWFTRWFEAVTAPAQRAGDPDPPGASAPEHGRHGAAVVVHFLEDHGAPYELLEHDEALTAAAEASASGVEPERVAKTVVLRDDDGFRLAVIPASEQLDLKRARRALGASGHLRLATEEEMDREFFSFDPGALPPFGSLLALPEVLDRRLLAHETVVCSSGDHRHSMVVSPRDIERLGSPLVADVCRHRHGHRHNP
jgi:putative phosphoribosyl transferase